MTNGVRGSLKSHGNSFVVIRRFINFGAAVRHRLVTGF
jgi:hypothetical protein